ncbi:MAG: hypothetical protein FJX76_28905, partial [Armatimonadetes bacterium]|nr:hypothetical protein [Armatimonadota bacterium]
PMEDGMAVIDGTRVHLPPFTVLGATTHVGRVPAPLRRRFRHHFRLDLLGVDDLAVAAWRAAQALGVRISEAGCVEVARRSKGTPRRAVQLVEWMADWAAAGAGGRAGELDEQDADAALLRLAIGREGFDEADRRYLDVLAGHFEGGPAGLRAMAAALGEEPDTVERDVEPWLVARGYVRLTPRGRTLGPGPGTEEAMA